MFHLHLLVGTAVYMAPEVANKTQHGYDATADLYSIGMIVYVMITGCSPTKLSAAPNVEEYLNYLFDNYKLSSECKDLISKLLTKGKRNFADLFDHPFLHMADSSINHDVYSENGETNYSNLLQSNMSSEQHTLQQLSSFVMISEPSNLTHLESTISATIQPVPLKYMVRAPGTILVRFQVTQGLDLFHSYNLLLTCTKQQCDNTEPQVQQTSCKFSHQQIANHEAMIQITVEEADVPCKITAHVSLSSWLSFFTSCATACKFVITIAGI